jgi:hypothetical protein
MIVDDSVEEQAGEAWMIAEWRGSMRITIGDDGLRPPNDLLPRPLSTLPMEVEHMDSSLDGTSSHECGGRYGPLPLTRACRLIHPRSQQ